jgi:hypothetical protein
VSRAGPVLGPGLGSIEFGPPSATLPYAVSMAREFEPLHVGVRPVGSCNLGSCLRAVVTTGGAKARAAQ